MSNEKSLCWVVHGNMWFAKACGEVNEPSGEWRALSVPS